MAEAMQLVKAELGPDAMIISSRKERRKGILGFFTKPVFRITATVEAAPQRKLSHYREAAGRDETTRDEFRNSMLEPLARELKELRERVDSLQIKEHAARQGVVPPPAPARTEQAAVASVGDFFQRAPADAELR